MDNTIGIDEAGRGTLVGSVVAGAVILPPNFHLPELTDSKKLTPKKRDLLYDIITKECIWAVGEASAKEIDEINILQATMLAMKRAAEQIITDNPTILVDGNKCPELPNCTAIIKGDLTEPAISAASIIAKVTRDRQMVELDQEYPNYGFAQHKGYGTKQHKSAILEFGPCPEHRFTFAPIKDL